MFKYFLKLINYKLKKIIWDNLLFKTFQKQFFLFGLYYLTVEKQVFF